MPQDFKIDVRRKRGRWTPEKIALACDMVRTGSTVEQIAVAVGMSSASVNDKLAGVERPKRQYIRSSLKVGYVTTAERAPPSAYEERERRSEAADRRTLSACLLGDPPPGYSAAAGKTGMT